MKEGVIYVCDNSKQHQTELLHSVKSLNKSNPNIKTAVFTNINKRWLSKFHQCYPINECLHPLKNKVLSIINSPFEKTLYLDVDTEICGDISNLFTLLDQYDLCLTHEPKIDYSQRPPLFINYSRKDEFNTGLILYKKTSPVSTLFEKWFNQIYQVENKKLKVGIYDDQLLFNQCFSANVMKCQFNVLNNRIFNTRFRAYFNMNNDIKDAVIIKHWHYLNKSKITIKLEEYYIYLLRVLFKIEREQIM